MAPPSRGPFSDSSRFTTAIGEALEQDLAAERLITAQVGALKEMLETARQRGDELKAERDRWAELVETNQRRIDELGAKRLGWWPFRKRA